MTREEFIEVLKEKEYPYEVRGNKIVVANNYRGIVRLDFLDELPSDVVFKNHGGLDLGSLETLPSGVEFRNRGAVWLDSLISLSPGVEFGNIGSVYLDSLTSLSPGVEFGNERNVSLDSLIGGWSSEWKANIGGIDTAKLLNLMIEQGVI